MSNCIEAQANSWPIPYSLAGMAHSGFRRMVGRGLGPPPHWQYSGASKQGRLEFLGEQKRIDYQQQ